MKKKVVDEVIGYGEQVINSLKEENGKLRSALAKSDPIHRVYDGTLPVLQCIHCGGRRGRFENEVQHASDCIWKLAYETKD